MARLVSVNIGLPRETRWRGKAVSTSIFKSPIAGRVRVERLNVAGDRQADLGVHGGADKAVYVYPSEHYVFWRGELPGIALPWGAFGENFTSEGLLESLRIGDRLRIGTAHFMVTQPRMPCFKLAIRFDRADMVKRFLASGRTGFYFKVLREGDVGAGDAIALDPQDEHRITVSDIVALYGDDSPDQALLRRASELSALPEDWRNYFRQRLRSPEPGGS